MLSDYVLCLCQYFVDTRLPFGSRSSPFLFNRFANLLAWILIFVYGIPNLMKVVNIT